ncbi:MAG: radical SAM protein [Elusimicrobia bacterium]|jgi:hypothetical protein|nr:radical SAM protein [Elusimicrobiota bacterium]
MTTSLADIETLLVGETSGSFSLVISPQATLSFDRAGRPTGLYENGFYTVRGLDGRCLEKKWVWNPEGEAHRHIRELPELERTALKERFLDLINSCRQNLPILSQRNSLRSFVRGRETPVDKEATADFLDFLIRGVNKAWTSDAAQFSKIWQPIGILPPDQYLALVVQVAEGCAWNQCTFCDFYSGRRSRVRTLEEVLLHAEETKRFFGPALSGRCSLFLGDANAFQAPPHALIPMAEELALRFPQLATPQTDGVGGIYSFADASRMSAWTISDLQALSRTGYRRAYIGVETGAETLRRELRKPGNAETVAESIFKLKSAGIAVGLIVLLGAGGQENASAHVRETADLLRNALLGPGDLLYFSPLIAGPQTPYGRLAAQKGWTALSEPELLSQRRALEAQLTPRGERRALYDIREFVY